MDLAQCEQQLWNVYKQDPWLLENFSALTKKAREGDKPECYKKMWWVTQIKFFIENSRNNKKLVSGPQTETQTNSWNSSVNIITAKDVHKDEHAVAQKYETTTTTESFFWDMEIIPVIKEYALIWLKIFIGIIVLVLLFKIVKYLLSFIYDIVNVKRIRYLKIIQPRWDWKLDREQAKEIAKDMKEKIGRMAQVYQNIHKLWELSFLDGFMKTFFKKPKLTLMIHYEDWQITFLVWVYPEYQKIIEGAIASQYPTCSIETIKRPNIYSKKYSYVIPMTTEKEAAYTIKMFKRMPDDPMNNVIDAISKVPRDDTFSVIMPIKPASKKFNKRAKLVATALFKKDKKALKKTPIWKYLLFPRKIFDFFLNGPSKALIEYHNEDGTTWDKLVRMVKTEEESVNAMWEEAANAAFESGLLLVTSSDDKQRIKENVQQVVSAFNVYTDQYANALDNSEKVADLLWFLVLPLRKMASTFKFTKFFFSKNVFTINELASLFHFPDATYNRSNIIERLQYKVLAGPINLPQFTTFNGFLMSWVVAEKFKDWKLSDILMDYHKHRSVGSRVVAEEKLVPAAKFTKSQLLDKEMIEKDGKQMVKVTQKKTVYGYKMSKEGVLLWINIYRNKYSPVYMKRDDRTRHHYCIWKSGTWKSVYLQTIARQDFWNGDWVCIIDPHGDLVEDLLDYIPKERAKDVIFFDAWQEDRPMGLNLYEIDNIDEADRTVNDATEMFIKMFGAEIFWPRIQEYFKFGSLTILEDFEDRPTILDVPRLFTDDTYREFKTKNVKNPVVRNFREKTFNAMGDREKKEIIPYFTSKFVSFNTNRLIRNIIWQTKSAFNLADVMDNRKILLISLSKGKIWDMNAQLLGMILVSKIYTAAMARAKIPEKDRKDFYLYVDEFQNFVSATFADILSEARKYRLCLIMAHQYIKQLESGKQWEWGKWDVKAAVFGNVWTMQSFKVGAPDAEFLEKEYSPVLWQQDIIWIANYKAYIKLNISNSTTRPFSMNSIWTQDYQNKKIAAILKEYSAKKYWRKREFVDAEIEARLWLGWDDEEGSTDDAASWEKPAA